jgi:GNAT superfamily N-acetyltransferase
MQTMEILLDGYSDLPPGKIANVVTYLEMLSPPAEAAQAEPRGLSVRRVVTPDVDWYRQTIRRIGEDWLWFSPLIMPEAVLATLIADPRREVFALERDGVAVGIAELDLHLEGEVEISFFGVVASEIGAGAGRFLMSWILPKAFRPGTRRVWLHTCSFDHPAAIRFYLRAGFTPYKFAIEVTDDPRLAGVLPETAGPHVPVIRPKDGAGQQAGSGARTITAR